MASVSEHCLNEIKPTILKCDKNKDRQYSIDEIVQLLKKNSKNPERLAVLLFKSLNKKLDESICFNDIDDREISKNCDKFQDKPEIDIESFLLRFDKNNDKMISHHELKTKLDELGCGNSKKTTDYVFEQIDTNKEGSLSYEDLEGFVKFLKQDNNKKTSLPSV
ncbi:EF-hand domain-containing protein [Dictyostelium discoideum AX4]|uniref:Calcium-binding protein I n=1 Tax=Dictyostelium discoideum TaxID=44689 RepID=CBPI_DICDI|nr:EF-hand domain-containing protein [Dictyostelium discoideum AX4]Q966R0.1 RecName: Full=Calcium-binding protein I; AltName: Full=Calcium-binding protein 9 [Dictyostelium discoideum]EAL71051.1 EF-hand domain-containing protein [Dictyostelium discoideum AX4]BAB63908.1 calcium binding protein CBP9 [Dictyostelium discoideum]|eukprot:XP_644921.1 EF-hand domain-containing protein [Dictyostelium discoideum AX4]